MTQCITDSSLSGGMPVRVCHLSSVDAVFWERRIAAFGTIARARHGSAFFCAGCGIGAADP